MKNVTYTTSGLTIFQYLGPSNLVILIAYLEDITNLEILPDILHFSEVLKNVNYQIFYRVTYVTGCYSYTLP